MTFLKHSFGNNGLTWKIPIFSDDDATSTTNIKYRFQKDINLFVIRRCLRRAHRFPAERTNRFLRAPSASVAKWIHEICSPTYKRISLFLHRHLPIRPSATQPLHLLFVARSRETRIPDGVSHKVASWRVIAGILKREKISGWRFREIRRIPSTNTCTPYKRSMTGVKRKSVHICE